MERDQPVSIIPHGAGFEPANTLAHGVFGTFRWGVFSARAGRGKAPRGGGRCWRWTGAVALALVAVFLTAPIVARTTAPRVAKVRWMKVRRIVIYQGWKAPACLLAAGQDLFDPPLAIVNREGDQSAPDEAPAGRWCVFEASYVGPASGCPPAAPDSASASRPLRC